MNDESKNKKIVIGILLSIIVLAIIVILFIFLRKKEYTVTFDSNGGTFIEAIKVKKNEKVTQPNDPIKEGYTFGGWYLDDELFDFDTKITKDITLEAYWSSNELELSNKNINLVVGKEGKIDFSSLPEDLDEKDLVYSSSDESIVTVDELGNLKALKKGTATITIKSKDGKYSVRCIVNVTEQEVEVESVSISGSSSVTIGSNIKLSVSFKPDNATNQSLTWKSSDESIATVDGNGNVKGLKAGTVTITVTTSNGKSATKKITVREKSTSNTGNKTNNNSNESGNNNTTTVEPTSVTISGNKEVNVGKTIQLSATVSPSDAANKSVTWSSSNSSIATVDSSGNVTGVSEGEVTITATTSNGKSATITVEVKSVYVITLTANKSETGSIRDYTITSVTKDGSSFSDFITFTYNNQTRKPEHIGRVMSADFVSSGVKTASIVLKNGKTVTATVEIR